jgi:putative hydrolase
MHAMADSPLQPSTPDEPDFAKLIEQVLSDPDNPALAQALKQMGIDKLDPTTIGLISSQMKSFFEAAPTEGLNAELAQDVARKTVAAAGDALVSPAERRAVTEAAGVAALWLDDVTTFTGTEAPVRAWSRAEWVAGTMPMWAELVGPVATGVTHAVGDAMRSQMEGLGEGGIPEGAMPGMPALPPGMDLQAMLSQMEPFVARMSSSMFGAQTGQAVGNLAGEVLTGTEVGLPLLQDHSVVLLPANIAAFAAGLDLEEAQVRLYLAVRENARVRLFRDVPWLASQLVDAVQAYARDITIDTDEIESRLSGLDPSDPEAMQEALSDALFSPTPSDAQKAALARLETWLALVEGWVDVVTDRATGNRLPNAAALGEAVRRRRASGGPAEHTFAQLVGLELRPRRLRDAANLFAALENAGGAGLRDGAWAHPDVAPTAADLDDPLAYVERMSAPTPVESDIDAALAKIFADAEAAKASEIEAEGPADAGPWPNYPDPPKRPRPGDPESPE